MPRLTALKPGPSYRGPRRLPVTLNEEDGYLAIVDTFTTGQCHTFALAMHDLTGWPMLMLAEDADWSPDTWGYWAHVVVRTPDGGYIDIKGRGDDPEEDWDCSAFPLTRDELLDGVSRGRTFPIPPGAYETARHFARLVLEED